MSIHQQIANSMGAHSSWKEKLQKAIASGASDVSVTAMRQDNQCDFGKWLYGRELSEEEKRSAHYEQCQRLHRQFHLEVSKVLTLALASKKAEAARAMEPGSDFAICSTNLTKAMTDWDKEAIRMPSSSGSSGHR